MVSQALTRCQSGRRFQRTGMKGGGTLCLFDLSIPFRPLCPGFSHLQLLDILEAHEDAGLEFEFLLEGAYVGRQIAEEGFLPRNLKLVVDAGPDRVVELCPGLASALGVVDLGPEADLELVEK